MRRRRTPEIIAGRVNADGSIAAATGEGFSVTKGGAGVFTINLPSGFRLIAATGASSDSSGGLFTYTATASINTIAVTIYTASTLVATDRPFSFIAVGTQQ